jgi:hypothetical protein
VHLDEAPTLFDYVREKYKPGRLGDDTKTDIVILFSEYANSVDLVGGAVFGI